MFEQCSSRRYVRGKSFLAELHELRRRSHVEHLSVEIFETVERAKVQIGLAPEFAALECFRSCNCRRAEKSTQLSSQWGPHVPFHVRGMFAPCSRCVRQWVLAVLQFHRVRLLRLGRRRTFPSQAHAIYKMHVLACSRTYVRVNICSKCSKPCSRHVRNVRHVRVQQYRTLACS